MSILRDAFRGIQDNLRALALYLCITVSVGILRLTAEYLVAARLGVELADLPATFKFGVDLGTVLCYAAAQSVAFALIGRELDKPLWKVSIPGEALRRFFAMWCIFGLCSTAAFRGILRTDSTEAAQLALLGYIIVEGSVIPLGACVMFHGRFGWRDLPAAFRPLARQFPHVLVLFFFSYLQLLVLLFTAVRAPHPALFPVVVAVSDYFGCVIFAGFWLVCRLDRDSEEPDLDW